MEKVLPKRAFSNLQAAIDGKEKLESQTTDAIAEALKSWAIENGATHYAHWFQPLNDAFAEKQDSFLSLDSRGAPIEQFHGKDLLRGEPDASSFPSGSLRSTHAARGYTVWDTSSSPFLWDEGVGVTTLCIPALFFSWEGDALDYKIPLLRSEEKIQEVGCRLLNLYGIPTEKVFSTLGPHQEYFVIERSLFFKRPDLVLSGRTVCGAKPPKSQELEDHYFGRFPDQMLSFMRDFEDAAELLGIPVKTRHKEVAPRQYEVVPLFEKSSIAIDHNFLLMELMKKFARKHKLVCLFHEKPFAGINGSGKHCNWSLATDSGLNLLDPEGNPLVFLTLITAVIHAVYENASLLRASIASPGNQYRLGGDEAPPAIVSVYLGDWLEGVIEKIILGKSMEMPLPRGIDLGISHIPLYQADASDRNRTSFFAFTGNTFEFRAVGASAHCGFPICVLNSMIADSLHLILDEIKDVIGDQKNLSLEELHPLVLLVLRKHLSETSAVIFGGNAYSDEWEREAKIRGLPHIRCGIASLESLLDNKAKRCFLSVLSERELHSRYETLVERYVKSMHIEARILLNLFHTKILPAALHDQKRRAKSLIAIQDLGLKENLCQTDFLETISSLISQTVDAAHQLEKMLKQIEDFGWEAKAKVFSEIGSTKMAQVRACIDRMEEILDHSLWPMPKYQELLYGVQ